MKQLVKLVMIPTVICVLAGVLLAVANNLTAEPIKKAATAEKIAAIAAVLPACDNDPTADRVTIDLKNGTRTFYIGRKDGRYVGAAFEVASNKGYGGQIRVMAGVTADGNVHGIAILSQKETPGLGAKIADAAFKKRFAGRSIRDTDWRVAKDGGDIDQITAATISSRAVIDAVRQGLDVYLAHEDRIRTAAK